MKRAQPSDHAERTRAIYERERNVIVDAGAGTGKTTLLVRRIVQLIAPDDDGTEALSLARIAAITFTRKAAGELKLRLRTGLLAERAREDLSQARRARVEAALATLDNASIGTVHSFADRLLRLRPSDARISPTYELVEDNDELTDETFRWLIEAAQNGTLVDSFRESGLDPLAAEAVQTLRTYMEATLLVETIEQELYVRAGLDRLVRDMINTRDRDVHLPEPQAPDMRALRSVADELHRSIEDASPNSPGTITLRQIEKQAFAIVHSPDLGVALRRAVQLRQDLKHANVKKGTHFVDNPSGWDAWKWLTAGERGRGKNKEEREVPLIDDLLGPLERYLCERLMRLRPLVIAKYEQVKRAHGVLDQIDLLLALRNLLASNLDARQFYQERFDHILVDEFQDTDPLQAEILLYLCEAQPKATKLDDIVLRAGKLTTVGDPKQSIYRFRRADIAMYAEVCQRIRAGSATEARLTVNFRSTGPLIQWVNTAFDAVLGPERPGALYNKEDGSVCNVRLSAGRKGREKTPAVHVLPFGNASLKADESRALEARALSHYIRHLVEDSTTTIVDPKTGEARRARYGDIAVLVVATPSVPLLLDQLDALGVPHVERGGTLFLRDPLHRQLILGLRALSDGQDGLAQAALLRPPFFALGVDDLVRERFASKDEVPGNVREARELIRTLRSERHTKTPGETARALIEQSGFGKFVASEPNGAQRLARCYELCLQLDLRARAGALDFDATTALAREWLTVPARMEAPLPIGADAVQVVTIHQAKGLEWPVVAWWDGRAQWGTFLPTPALTIDAVEKTWAIALDRLRASAVDPQAHAHEVALLEQERRRLVYVAATRARDVLIVPRAGEPEDKYIAGKLLASTAEEPRLELTPLDGEGEAWWESRGGVSLRPPPRAVEDARERFQARVREAMSPALSPKGVSAATHEVRTKHEDEPSAVPAPRREGRYGPLFGTTVHRALALLLDGSTPDASEALARAAAEHDLIHLHGEALDDTERALKALSQHGLLEGERALEYPVGGSIEPGSLLSGFIDLLVLKGDQLWIIDFKTDAAPQGDVRLCCPQYVSQVDAYAELLAAAGVPEGRRVHCALLFTADGSLHAWART